MKRSGARDVTGLCPLPDAAAPPKTINFILFSVNRVCGAGGLRAEVPLSRCRRTGRRKVGKGIEVTPGKCQSGRYIILKLDSRVDKIILRVYNVLVAIMSRQEYLINNILL